MVQLQQAIFGRVMIPWAQILLIINFSITQALDNYIPWKRTPILPVIHNLETFQVPTIIDALDGIKCCTVSLRHANAMLSLKELTEQFGPYCDVGVSTVVSSNQIREAEANGALFISTTYHSKALITEAETFEMPILCGVLTFKEAKQALLSSADALKFYPATAMKPKLLAEIINQLKDEGLVSANKMVDIIVAGGVLDTDLEAYLQAGATGFAIGFDCRKVTPRQIQTKLKDLNDHYKSIKGG